MKKYYEILSSAPLFKNICETDFEKILTCLNAKVKKYKKNSVILMADDKVSAVGIILFGTAKVIKEDILGHQTILTEVTSGGVFAETLACADVQKSPVTVLSVTACEVLFIDYQKIVAPCSSACVFHRKLIENMLRLIAGKNLMLNQKIELISKRTTKERLMAYFMSQVDKTGGNSFTCTFSRQELADYLCVDRSAMSRELSTMQTSGLISFSGNKFVVLP